MTSRNKNGKFAKKEVSQEMLTLSQASAQFGVKRAELKKIVLSSRYARIFTQPDNLKITHYHDDVEDLIEINPVAWDQYLEAKAHGIAGNRATRKGRDRKWLMYIPDARLDEFKSLMERAQFNQPVTAYKAKVAKSDALSDIANASAPTDLVEELIEA